MTTPIRAGPLGIRARIVLLGLGFIVVAVGGLVFAVLLDDVMDREEAARLDAPLARLLADHRRPAVTAVMRVVTRAADGWVIAPLVAVVAAALLLSRHRRLALALALSTAGTAVLVEVAKVVVGRARPPIGDRLVAATGLAFPSGHAAQAVACYGALAVVAVVVLRAAAARVAVGALAGLVALLVGVSRVYLGVHWPSDVVSGWALGAAWLAAVLSVLAAHGGVGAPSGAAGRSSAGRGAVGRRRGS